jgi:hypothetical protein
MNDVIVAPSVIHGLGVFATGDFCPGETVLLIDDSRMVDEEHPLRPECGEYEYHCDYLAGGKIVLLRPPERHINSGCDPNTCVRWESGKRYVIARRAIGNGEEITYDYIIDCHGGKEWECQCGSARCRGIIVSSFFELSIGVQREYLPLLSVWFIEEHRESVERSLKQIAA